jgi:pilus assembly protein CpaB
MVLSNTAGYSVTCGVSMNSRSLLLSLAIGIVAVLMVSTYTDSVEKQYLQMYGAAQPVVVAKVDIEELDLIDDSKVTIINVPEKFRMPGYLKRVEEVYNTIATVPIKAGEQITLPRITQPGSRTGLSSQISVGKRAYSLNITDGQAVGKLIKPGDRVDILALISYAPGQLEKMQVKTVLQDILVLSTGYNVTNALPAIGFKREQDEIKKMNLNTYTDYNTVTFELDPIQVQKIVYLINSGSKLNLSLRNNDDKKVESLEVTEIFDVLGEGASEARDYYQKKNGSLNIRNPAGQ